MDELGELTEHIFILAQRSTRNAQRIYFAKNIPEKRTLSVGRCALRRLLTLAFPNAYDFRFTLKPADDRDAALGNLEMRGQRFDHGLICAPLLRRSFDQNPELPSRSFQNGIFLGIRFYSDRMFHDKFQI
jgi:hypothetical protein